MPASHALIRHCCFFPSPNPAIFPHLPSSQPRSATTLKSYTHWPFDQFVGKNEAGIKTELLASSEVFGAQNREMMSDALQLARKWSSDVQVKLGGADRVLQEKVRRWFHLPDASEEEIRATIAILTEGFKRFTATCNSTSVIFSDNPPLRNDPEFENTYAAVYSHENMPVIYLFELFLEIGRRSACGMHIPKLWLCAATIIHELSHKLMKAEDFRYDDDGLRPCTEFPPEVTIKNADSWAYFAADVMGVISQAVINRVLKRW